MAICLRRIRFSPVLKKLFRRDYVEYKIPDPWDLVTGEERWEVVQYAKGNTNPYLMRSIKRGPGTKDCPNVVPSVYDKRIVGCVCSSSSMHIVYWWIHEGFPRRCDCNYWFVLERVCLPRIYEDS